MSARRARKTERGLLDCNVVLAAIKDMVKNKIACRTAAAAYKITKSSMHNYYTRFIERVPDIDLFEESELLNIVKDIVGYGVTTQVSFYFYFVLVLS